MKTLRLHLTPDEHWRLPDVACWRLRCDSGVLWISCAGDERDYILRAGQVVELAQKRGVVVGAFDAVSCSIEAPSPTGLFHRLMSGVFANQVGIKA